MDDEQDLWKHAFDEITGDTLVNFETNLNTLADKSLGSSFQRRALGADEFGAMYRFGGIAGKIIDVVPDDATRKWRTLTLPATVDRKAFETKEKELGVASAFARMGKWGRLYGTAIIIPIIANDKDGDTTEPLDERTISPDNPVTGLRVLSWPDLVSTQLDRMTERPSVFIDWRDGNRAYHSSRAIGPFDGIELPLDEYSRNAGRGGSVLERCYDSLLNKAQASAQISPLIHEALVKLVGIDDLPRYLSGGADEQKFIQRWIVAKRLASCQNVMLYDKGREEIKDSTAVSALAGLAALLTEFGQELAGECDIPMTRLQGQVTGGLNTSASTNLRDYYSMVKAFQSNRFEPLLAKLDRLLLRSCYGDLPADYWMEWAALDDPTELEQAQVNKTNAETDEIQLRTGAIVPAHVSARINEDGPYELSEEFIEFMKERDGLTTAAKPTEEMTTVSTGGGGGAEIQSQVLNGAQISGLIEIATKVKSGEISAESGVAIVRVSVPSLTEEQARDIVGEYDEAAAEKAEKQKEQAFNGMQKPEEVDPPDANQPPKAE
jgi:uncharacterized protein